MSKVAAPQPGSEAPAFTERPGPEIIDDFLAHIRRGGAPHEWKWHRHTAPAKNAKPVLLKDFDLPEAVATNQERWARCPLCAPDHPKYMHGVLVWFPSADGGDDAVRAIGHECGARFFGKQAFRAARDVYRREQDEQAERAYLSRVLPHASTLRDALQEIAPRAEAVGQLRAELLKFAPRDFVRILEQATSIGGMLTVQVQVPVTFVRQDGSTGERTEPRASPLVAIRGAAFLSAMKSGPGELCAKAIAALDTEFPSVDGLSASTAEEVHVLVKRLREAADCSRGMHETLNHARLFCAVENLEALHTWTRHPDSGAPVRIIVMDGRPRLSIYRRVRSNIPSMGFRDKPDVVRFDEIVRLPLTPLPLLDP